MPQFDWNQLKLEPGQLPQPIIDPLQQPRLDPVTGEDASNDNRMTFLVAVVLDPPPLAPPAPAAPAEGQEAAPGAAPAEGQPQPEGAPPAAKPPAESAGGTTTPDAATAATTQSASAAR
jgi:hypothetical protein